MTDVLVIGAGPTGLALAACLVAHGVRPRIVDRSPDRVHESRALAIQPRTLEVLAPLGITEELVGLGNRGVRLSVHAHGSETVLPLFDDVQPDTAYPFLLFLSQAETERVLEAWLRSRGLTVERGVTLQSLRPGADGNAATLGLAGGEQEHVTAPFVVGCDGGRSAVRTAAGIAFEGSSYPQSFILADLEADGIDAGAAHAFLSGAGMLFYFPLVRPASWRLLAMDDPSGVGAERPGMAELQALSDAYTGGGVRLHDPVWTTRFRLHHRAAASYRSGGVFLAGDAAHVHSPAGAQGMNTGIQDAVNLAWKLAQVLAGRSDDALLDTYDRERRPIGRTVLRFTDRAFRVSTSTNALVGLVRSRVAPAMLSLVLNSAGGRAAAFRRIGQLDIRYPHSPLSVGGAGDRLPDALVTVEGRRVRLHSRLDGVSWNLLLCGPSSTWDEQPALPGVVNHRLSADDVPGALVDVDGTLLRRLSLAKDDPAQLLVRPDGHIGYRAGGSDLQGLSTYHRRWVSTTS